MTAAYEGLTKRQKLFIAGSAIFAVFVSLIFAASIMQDALRNTEFSQRDQEAVNQLLGDTKDPQHKSVLRAQAIDAVANLKQLANRQAILIVAFAGAFALSAVGAALFLLGADGVLRMQAEQGKGGVKLLLAGTAPAILCFVLAVILMGMAIAHRSSIHPAPVNFSRQTMEGSENSAPRSLAGADTGNNTDARKAKEAAEQLMARQEAQDRAAKEADAAKLAAEKAAAEKVAAGKLIADELAAAKSAAEKAAAEKRAAEKTAAEKRAAEKAASAKSAAAKAEAEKLATDKASAAKVAADKASAAKAAADRASAAKVAADKASAAKLAADKASAAKVAADTGAANRLAAEKALADRLKLAADRAATDRRAADTAASNKLAADKATNDAARAERSAADRVDVANLIAEKIAAAGAPPELYKRAIALRHDGDTRRAVALLRYASSNGHGPSSQLLAVIFRDGAPDLRANFREAERYQALADAQGRR